MRLRIAPLTAMTLLALGAANAWLLTVLLRSSDELEAHPPAANRAPLAPLSDMAPDFSSKKPATTAYPETLARPVFYKTRTPYVRPPPPPPPQAAPRPAPPPVPADPGIGMGGVAINGTAKKAYLFKKGSTQGGWIAEGEVFMGWTVQSIDAGGVKLRQAGRLLDVQLYERR